MDVALFVIFGVFAVGVAAWLRSRRHKSTRIDETGVLVVRSLAKPLFLPWPEISRFGIASLSEIQGGLHEPGFSQYAGVSLTDLSPMKASKACVDNRRLSDYDILLTPDSGMSVEAFVAYLESAKAKFQKV